MEQVASIPQAIALNRLRPGKNPRTYFGAVEMAELTESVRANGVMQAILVRPLAGGHFEIIAGERRTRAAQAVYGDEWEIPALVRDCDDDAAQRLGLIENTDRAAMSHAEEAERAYSILMRENGDHAEAARKLGWSITTLRRRLALMALLPEVREALTHRKIQLGHAELLAGAVPHDEQLRAVAKIVEHKLTVEQVKAFIASKSNDLNKAVFDRTECAGCPHNSAQQAALFGEALKEGQCTKPPCYQAKTEGHLEAIRTSLLDEVPKVIILRQESGIATIKLVAEGQLGVGLEQAKACRSCENFGCTVSAVVGSVGEVEKDICFDGGCHTLKVATSIKALRAEARGNASNAPAATRKGKDAGEPTQAPKQSEKREVSVSVPQKVKDYRLAQWRRIAAKVTFGNPEKAFLLLVSLGLSGNSRHIDATKLREILMALTKAEALDFHGSLKGAAEAVEKLTPEVVKRLSHAMACSALKQVEERQLVGAMEFLSINIGEHWKLDSEFLGLLTKSEMIALAEEIGLASAMGDKEFKKAAVGKKDEFMKALLAIEGFAYQGALPKVMDYRQGDTADALEEPGADASDGAGATDQGQEADAENGLTREVGGQGVDASSANQVAQAA